MSRAFVKEGQEAEAAELPDRLISPHPNYVTVEGLAQIEAEVARLSEAYAAAQTTADRAALAGVARDLRYWTARRASAEVVRPVKGADVVRFGSKISFFLSRTGEAKVLSKTGKQNNGRRRQTYRIVGEDEAEPANGTLSYVSPMARALMGMSVGDTARVPGGDEVELVAIE